MQKQAQQAGTLTAGPKPVNSNQIGIHEKLDDLVLRYQQQDFKRPLSEHTVTAFNEIKSWLLDSDQPLILDSCCGVGESTARIAAQYPNAKVLGVDKSEHRLEKHHAYALEQQNYRVLRADLNDLWRLLVEEHIVFVKHFLLYPNPYPKASQIQKRWYACALMPYIMKLSSDLEVRSNWQLYLQEFEIAVRHYGFATKLLPVESGGEPLTPFERKYQESGQTCYRLLAETSND
jgi:tRNA G46 methylase TrmB